MPGTSLNCCFLGGNWGTGAARSCWWRNRCLEPRLLFCWSATNCILTLDHLLPSHAWGVFDFKVQGSSFVSDFRSSELELCSLQGSDALSVSLSRSYQQNPHYSSRKGGPDLLPPWSRLLFSEQLVSGGKDVALLLVGSRPYAGRRRRGRTPESLLFSVFFRVQEQLCCGSHSFWLVSFGIL